MKLSTAYIIVTLFESVPETLLNIQTPKSLLCVKVYLTKTRTSLKRDFILFEIAIQVTPSL